jgi:hypothetical protein
MDMPQQDPALAQPATPEAADSGGYEICIRVSGDQISVGVESGDQEAGEGASSEAGGGMDAEGGTSYTPVADISEALAMAKDIFRNNGQMPQNEEDAAMAQAKSGYAKHAMKSDAGGGLMQAVYGD